MTKLAETAFQPDASALARSSFSEATDGKPFKTVSPASEEVLAEIKTLLADRAVHAQANDQLLAELTQVRARGWALADEELAPGVRSVAVPVRDGAGRVRAAMNVTVHAAETSTEVLMEQHLPRLLRTAGDVSAEWALWQSRPHAEVEADSSTA